MKRIILSIALAAHLAVPAAAQQRALLELALAGDHQVLSDTLSALHEDHRAGRVDAEAVRRAWTTFELAAPGLEATLADWLEVEPDSPFALAAASVHFWGHGWRMRGDGLGFELWPEAEAAFAADMERSAALAARAYAMAPDLLPASDMVLATEMVTRRLGPEGVLELAGTVTEHMPNRGTLHRAAMAYDPRWNGDLRAVEALCEVNAGRITAVPDYSPLVCVADMVLTVRMGEPFASQAFEVLAEHGWHGMDDVRRSLYESADFPLEAVGLSDLAVADYLLRPDVFEPDLARRFFAYHAPPPALAGLPNAPEPADPDLYARAVEIMRKHRTEARALLALAPGDADLLGMARAVLAEDAGTDDPGRPDALAAWGAVLEQAPYDPRWWRSAATALSERTSDRYRMPEMGAFGNAIAYSNHSPQVLGIVLGFLTDQYSVPYHARQYGKFDEATFDHARFQDGLLCPVIRVARLFEAVCESGAAEAGLCPVYEFRDELVADARALAEEQGACQSERLAPVGTLVFEPVALRVGPYEHRVTLDALR